MTNKQMNEENVQRKNKRHYESDIHERIYNFVIRVVNLTKALPKTPKMM